MYHCCSLPGYQASIYQYLLRVPAACGMYILLDTCHYVCEYKPRLVYDVKIEGASYSRPECYIVCMDITSSHVCNHIAHRCCI